MKESFVTMLRCPICGASDWVLESGESNEVEVLEAKLTCRACGRTFPVSGGVVDLVPLEMLADLQVRDREEAAASDRRIAGQKRQGTFVGKERAREEEYRIGSFERTEFLFGNIEYDAPQQRWVLDLGSGPPTLSNRFARLGFNVVALDFIPSRLEGAHELFQRDGTFFERVAGMMENLPLGDRTIDLVFSHASLHHATPRRAETFKWFDPANLLDTLREVRRILKPDGLFLVSGEGEYPEEVTEEDRHLEREAQKTGCYEAFYKRSEYEWAFREAGIAPHLWAQSYENRLRVGTFLEGRYRAIVTAGDAVNTRSDILLAAPALEGDLNACLSPWARVRPWPGASAHLARSGGVLAVGDEATFARGWHGRETDVDGDFRWMGRDPATIVFRLDYLPVAWTFQLTIQACSLIGAFDTAILVERDGKVVARNTVQLLEERGAGDREIALDADLEAGRATVRCIRDGHMRVHVYLNGDHLTTLQPPSDNAFHTCQIDVPAEKIRTLNQLTLEPSYALRACDWQDSADDRWLSCAVRDVKIMPKA